MLISYRGVVEGGKVRLQGSATLPEGTEVVVVAASIPLLSVEEQKKRLAQLAAEKPDEWREPFDALLHAWDESQPTELEAQPLSDTELETLIQQAREEVYAERRA